MGYSSILNEETDKKTGPLDGLAVVKVGEEISYYVKAEVFGQNLDQEVDKRVISCVLNNYSSLSVSALWSLRTEL